MIQTRQLFNQDSIHLQAAKLAAALQAAVDGLTDLPCVIPILQALGRSHARYPIGRRHFDSAGGALLWTLEPAMGADWTAATRAAWATLCDTVAGVMTDVIEEGPARRLAV
ncbi:MAG: hemin receptor [Chromatiaceae bacterium]|nr:hemin receptor [Chromatiaceae bacterium]